MKQKLAALLTVAALALCALPMAVSAEGNVAKIGDKEYATLQEAVSHAPAGIETTVTLLTSSNESVTIPAGKSIKLELNGQTLTNQDGNHTIINNGTLTVQGTGTIDNITHGKAALVNYGTVTLNGGLLTRSREAGSSASDNGGNSWYTVFNQGSLTINDGAQVTQNGKYSSLIENGWPSDYTSGTATLVVNGGTLNGGINAIKNDEGGTATINGGNITGNNSALMNWNVALVNSGTFSSVSGVAIINSHYADNGSVGQLTIKGGSFTSGNNGANDVFGLGNDAKGTGSILVEGGTFTGLPNKVADNKLVILPAATFKDSNGTSLTPPPETIPVAQVGTVYYLTLAEAATAAAATPEKTLTLKADATLDSMLTINTSGMVIDLGGFTVSASDKFQKDADNNNNHLVDITADNVTLKNGTLKAGANNNHTLNVWNAKGVQLSGLKLDNAASYGGAPLIVGASAVTVNDGLNVVTGANSWYGINVDSRNVGSVSNPINKGASITVAPNVSLVFEGQKSTGIYMENNAGMNGNDVKLGFGSGVTFNSSIPSFVPVVVATGDSATVTDPGNAGLQDNGDGTFGKKPAPTPKPEEPWTPGPTATPAPAQVLDSTPKTGAVSLAVLPLAGLAFAGLGFVTRKREE